MALRRLLLDCQDPRQQGDGPLLERAQFRLPEIRRLIYHAKGATPAYHGYADDASGLTLVPLNMREPILITRPARSPNAYTLGFAPHGAGRNTSRTAHLKMLEEEFGGALGHEALQTILARETEGVDVRFFTGTPDVSELPSAYKNAAQVSEAIERHGLAEIIDRVNPLGTIMAGEMNWNRRR